jgi:PAS domain S-box-containing protein
MQDANVNTSMRKTGLDFIKEIPWGSHLCQLYIDKNDLLEVLIPYFKTGLENNEFCMWIVSDPINPEEAKMALQASIADFEERLSNGQMVIVKHSEWYLQEGSFEPGEVINGWINKLNQALLNGYEGLRLSGNTLWLKQEEWDRFTKYEEQVDAIMGSHKIIALCTYCLDKCSPLQIVDVLTNHQYALVKREVNWEAVASARRKNNEYLLKEAEESLRESRDQIRQKLESILEDPNDLSRLELTDFIDIPALRSMMEDFYELSGIPMSIVDTDDNILVGVGLKKICKDFHRINLGSSENCIESDTVLTQGRESNKCRLYKCKNNLWEMVSPITAGGKQLGYMVMGQFFFDDEGIDMDMFRKQAVRFGSGEKEYLESLEQVPRLSKEKASTGMTFIMKLANCISKLSHSNINLIYSLAKQDVLNNSLKDAHKKEAWLARFPEENPDPIIRVSFDKKIIYANPAAGQKNGWDLQTGNCLPEALSMTVNKALEAGRAIQDDVELNGKEYTVSLVPVIEEEYINVYGRDITERKKIEREHRELSQKYLSILQLTSDYIYQAAVTEDGKVFLKWINNDPEKHTGYSFHEIKDPVNWKKIIYPNDWGAFSRNIQDELQGKNIELEFRIVTKDGQIRWVYLSGQPERDVNSGKVIKITGIIRDINERKRMEEELAASEKRWRNLAESMPNMIWTCNPDGGCDYLSKQWINYTGIPLEEQLDREWVKQVHPDDLRGLEEAWQRSVETGEKFDGEYRLRRHDGVWHWFKSRAIPVHDRFGNIVKWYGSNVDVEDLKQITKSLQQSQEDLKRAQSVANVGSWRYIAENELLYWSDENYKIFGLSPGTPLNYEKYFDLIHPEDRDYVNNKWINAMKGDVYDIEHRIIVNGKVKWVKEKAELEHDRKGRIIGAFGTTQDITKRKEAQETVNSSLRRFALLAHTSSELLHTNDPQKEVERLCSNVMELLGCQVFFNYLDDNHHGKLRLNAFAGVEENIKKRIEWIEYGELVCGNVAASGCPRVVERIQNSADKSTEFIRLIGIKAYACHPLMGPDGALIGTLSFGSKTHETFSGDDLSIMKAVTDLVAVAMLRMQTQEALRISEERFRLVALATNDGIWDFDIAKGRFWCNEAYSKIFGPRPLETASSMDWWFDNIYTPDQERTIKSLRDALAGPADQWNCEYRFICGDGRIAYVHDRAYIIRNEKGEAVRVLGAMMDVTTRKNAERILERDKKELEALVREKTTELLTIELEMEKVKRLSDIGMLAATVAHELRNPLAAIRIATGNIKRKIDTFAIQKNMETIEKKVNESDQIINNLLFYARLRSPRHEPIQIRDVLNEIIETRCSETGARKCITTAVDLDAVKDVILEADQLHIHELFTNLLNNACDAVPESGGRIEVDADFTESGRIRFRIKDNGIGMDNYTLQRIWEPFYSTKSKGTGLGLSVCNQIVNLHNGNIDIKSEIGKGTMVTVELPLSKNTPSYSGLTGTIKESR